MNITQIAIKNNHTSILLLLIIVAVGIATFINMPRAYDPGFIVRAAQVVTYFPGASPERVEQLVSSKLEDVVKEMPELDFVSTESRTGVSITIVNIKESYTDIRPIWDKLRRKVEDVAGDLPEGVSGPFVNDEFGDVFGVVLSLRGEGFSYAEVNDIAEDVRDELQRLPDVAKVEIYGSQDERVYVEYDNARLAELGVSPNQLAEVLNARNIVISGGSFLFGDERISLEPSGNFESIEDIENTVIRLPNSSRIFYLKDIATISRGYVDPPTSLLHSSGENALALAISMREGGNNIALGEQVNQTLQAMNERYPWGVEFDRINFSPAEVDKKVQDFVINLLQAIAVVTVVMLFSLGLRTGLVVAALIPLAMLLALIVMNGFSIGLDQISLAALIIALGMLVDNGIVMSENIMVQMEQGKSSVDAAIDSAAELRLPLLTASLTTAAAFLPIYLAESVVGEFTASLFKVVTITLLCSWLISLTLIPVLCVRFLKVQKKKQNFESWFYRAYRSVLAVVLNHRAITLFLTVVVFGLSMTLFSQIPKVFFPPSDRSYFKVELELPTGTSIERTTRVVSDMELFLQANWQVNQQRQAGVTNWVSYIGNAGPRFVISHNPKPSNSGYALMVVNVNSLEKIDPIMMSLKHYALKQHPDLDLKTKRIENGPAIENPVEIRLSGSDSDKLFAAMNDLKLKMANLGGLTNISDDWGQRIKKFDIEINQARALSAGVTSQDIAVSLQTSLDGLQLTEYREGEDIIPVLLRSAAATQQDLSKVEGLSVYIQSSGQSLPLTQVADINVVWDVSKVLRRNGLRTISIGAQLEGDVTAAEQFSRLTPWLEAQKAVWGNTVSYELGGEQETSGKSNDSIVEKLPIAGFIILLLLVAQFNSIRSALIILVTIPLGLIGVAVGLFVAQSFMGFMTFLGVISLAGIVINNAIVLLERINIELENGLAHVQAIMSAAQQRARPILLTTATTVLGLMPLYLGGGEMWEPMAVSIMAGLLFSTIFTLCVVPVLYAVFYKVEMVRTTSPRKDNAEA